MHDNFDKLFAGDHVNSIGSARKKLELVHELERYEPEIEAMHKEINDVQDKLVNDAKLQKITSSSCSKVFKK